MNKIFLNGSVGFSWWEEDCFTLKSVREQLAGMSGPLTVHLNSGGGIATEGQAIYNALKNYEGEVTVIIDGIAASAASLIAMAGDEIIMPLGSIMMIHDPALFCTQGRGTEQDHLDEAKNLGVIARAYAAVYAARAGITIDDAREIMKAETYFDGDSAVAAGFASKADEALNAEQPAAFDYRLYAKAPANLRAIAANIAAPQTPNSMRAMMAGFSPKTGSKEHPMSKSKKPSPQRARVLASVEDEQDLELEETPEEEIEAEEEDLLAEEDNQALDEEDEAQEDEDPEAKRVASIMRFTTAYGVTADVTARYIAGGLTLKQVMKMHPAKGSNMTRPRPPLARSQILRDERATRRSAATEALHAQMTGAREVSAAARPFMTMSIVEIAANVSGQNRAVMRNFGDREEVLMAASHTTSDFPSIFQNALNKVLLDRYASFEPTYRAIAKRKDFRDFRPMPLVRAGDFPMLKEIGEGGEIKAGTFGESGEKALLVAYGRRVTISRQMMVNDELGAISELMESYGQTISYFEERTFYAAALTAKLSDNKSLFHADHGNLGAGAALNVTSVSAGRTAMRKQKSIDGISLNLAPSILLVGPDQETAAEMLVAQITPTSEGAVNPFSGKLSPVVSAEITGKAWYLLSGLAPCWVYGYLEGRDGPRVRTEEPFGTQGFSMSVEHDFGFGAADFRGGYKNPGA